MDLFENFPKKIKEMFRIPGGPSGYLPSGSIMMDLVLSGGKGYPLGGIIELAGEPDSGKTTMGLLAIAEARKRGGYGLIINTERELDPKYMENLGVGNCPVLQSENLTIETIFGIIELAVDTYLFTKLTAPLVFLWDSGANSYSKEEVRWQKIVGDRKMKESKPAVRASHLSEWLRQGIITKLNKGNILILITNHLKETFIPKWMGESLDSPLGRALKFLCLSRNLLDKSTVINNPSEGIVVKITNVSGKQMKPYRSAKFYLYPDERKVDNYQSVVEALKELNILKKDSGGRIEYGGQKLNTPQLIERARKEKETWEELKNLLLENW